MPGAKAVRVMDSAVGEVPAKGLRAWTPEGLNAHGLNQTGVAPVGHRQPVATYIDQDLLQYDEIWAAAGTPNSQFKISPDELVRITGAPVVAVK